MTPPLPIGTIVYWWSFTRRPRQQDGYRFALHAGTIVPHQEPFPLRGDVADVEMVHGDPHPDPAHSVAGVPHPGGEDSIG